MVLFLLIILLVLGCKQKLTGATAAPGDSTVQTPAAAAPKIIYVAVTITKDPALPAMGLTLDTVMYFEGSLGKKGVADTLLKPDYLLCTFLTNTGKPLKQLVVKNPLYRYVEYEQENKELVKKQAELSRAGISIRTDYRTGMDYLQLEAITTDLNLTLLGKIAIPKR